MVLNLVLSFLSEPFTSVPPAMVTSWTLSLFTSSMSSVKVKSLTRSPVLDRTTAQISSAVTAMTTQKMMFLTAEFTLLPPGIPPESPSGALAAPDTY
jgi:hypothetical protein